MLDALSGKLKAQNEPQHPKPLQAWVAAGAGTGCGSVPWGKGSTRDTAGPHSVPSATTEAQECCQLEAQALFEAQSVFNFRNFMPVSLIYRSYSTRLCVWGVTRDRDSTVPCPGQFSTWAGLSWPPATLGRLWNSQAFFYLSKFLET